MNPGLDGLANWIGEEKLQVLPTGSPIAPTPATPESAAEACRATESSPPENTAPVIGGNEPLTLLPAPSSITKPLAVVPAADGQSFDSAEVENKRSTTRATIDESFMFSFRRRRRVRR